MKVNIIGPLFGSSGFASHTKQLATAMHELGIDVRLDCQKPQGWETMVNDMELNWLTKPFETDMVSIMIGQPPSMPFAWAENPKTVIPFIIWEGTSVPKYWMKYLEDPRVKQIWVPSEHIKLALVDKPESPLLEKIKVIPHGVDLNIFNPDEIKEVASEKQPFTFLANKGWSQGINDRGGIQWLLKAYTEEFTKDDDVVLRLKINPSYFVRPFDFHAEADTIGIKKTEKSPAVLLSTDSVDFKMMPTFYNGDVFVSPTMGDAFNIPCLEAQAMGVPVITTDFGGQTDYVDQENGWLINYELVDSPDMNYEGIKWAKPDIEELRKTMRDCFENQEKIKEKGKLSRENARKFTWKESAKKAIAALKELR